MPSKENEFNLEAFLKTELKEESKKPEGLSDIQAEVVENLDLIAQLAEQIAELDIQAYDVFSKQRSHKRQKNYKLGKKASRKESRKESREESYEYEDIEDEDYFVEPERKSSKSQRLPTGRIRNLGLRIRQ